jgi:hypothetical protein
MFPINPLTVFILMVFLAGIVVGVGVCVVCERLVYDVKIEGDEHE